MKGAGRWRKGWGLTVGLLVLLVPMVLQGCGGARGEARPNSLMPPSDPVQIRKLDELGRLSDELYRLSEEGKFVQAREKLSLLGEQATALSYEGLTSVEGVDALTSTIVEAKRQLNAVKLSPDKVVHSSAKLKLAFDALSHPNQPIWLQYYKLLTEDTRVLEAELEAGQPEKIRERFTVLKGHYDTIRPSVWINRTPSEGEKMDSILKGLENQLNAETIRKEEAASILKFWKESLDELFHKTGDRTAYLPSIQPDEPFKWSLTIGSLIIAVLAFSAWRMFRVDQQRIRTPRRLEE